MDGTGPFPAGADKTDERFKDVLRKIAKHKPEPQPKKRKIRVVRSAASGEAAFCHVALSH
jgi:hypothetical protein